jgi:hypothetical protein
MKNRRNNKLLYKAKWILVAQVAGVVLSALCSGCATSGYMGDRIRDAGDIFTATVGKGAGVKARIGPVGTGLFVNKDIAGLRGGTLFRIKEDAQFKPYDFTSIIPKLYMFPIFIEDRLTLTGESKLRHKDFEAIGIIVPLVSWVDEPNNSSTKWAYNTQIEVAVGLGGTLRLGLNPGELVDFALGWTTIDIYNDDIEKIADKMPKDTACKPADPQH